MEMGMARLTIKVCQPPEEEEQDYYCQQDPHQGSLLHFFNGPIDEFPLVGHLDEVVAWQCLFNIGQSFFNLLN